MRNYTPREQELITSLGKYAIELFGGVEAAFEAVPLIAEKLKEYSGLTLAEAAEKRRQQVEAAK